MKDYNRAENKVLKPDAARISADKSAYSPAKSKASGASETGSSAKLGGRGSSGNKSRNHRYGGFKGTALVVLLTFSMVFASLLGAFADDLVNTVPTSEAPGGTFYSNEIHTGFDNYGATADDGPGYGPYTVAGVQQSQSTTSPTSFAAGLPLGTIFIDQDMITGVPVPAPEVVSKDTAIIAGLTNDVNDTNQMGYDGTKPGAIKLIPGKVNELNGELFKVTYSDAAILPNGDRADLVITYSNAKIVIDERYLAAPDGTTYYEKPWVDATYESTTPAGVGSTQLLLDSETVYRSNSGKFYVRRKVGSANRYYLIHCSPATSQPTNPSDTGRTIEYLGTTYKIYSDGTKEYIKPDNQQYYNGAAILARGNAFNRGGNDTTNFRDVFYAEDALNLVHNSEYSFTGNKGFTTSGIPYPCVGTSLDATYQIVNKDGTPAAGTFVFAVCGINLDRDPDAIDSNNVDKPLWYSYDENFGGENGKEYSFFSEAMEILNGQKSDYVYVRPNTNQEDNPEKITGVKGQYFWPNVSITGDGNIKFISNAVNGSYKIGGDDNSYNAGFVTLADAAKGFTVTGTGHGRYGQGMNSIVFNSKQIWYRYTSTTGPNGNIQITTEGNHGGKLVDGGTVLEPGTYVVAEGKTTTYTMTPDYGYKIKELKIGKPDPNNRGRLLRDSSGNIVYEEVTLPNSDQVSKMKKGDSLTWTTAAGNDAELVYDYDGTYRFKLPYANNDEAVHVEWEPTTADILAHKAWSDSDDKDGMRKGTDGTADWPKLKLQYSTDGGVNWDDVTENYYGENIDRQDVPTGKDTTGNYKDGIYAVGTDTTTGNGSAKHPYTWEYLPIYEYDSNGKTAGEILYRIVEGTDAELDNDTYSGNNPALEGYHAPDYRDVQQFNLLSNETKTKDGLQIYKGADGKQYVRKSDNKYYPVTNWEASATAPDPQPTGAMTPLKTGDSKKIDIGGTEYQIQINKSNNPKYRNQEFVHIGTDWYRIVYNEKSDVVVKVPTDPDELADFNNMADSTLNGFNTADKADPYKSVAVRNEHNVSDIDIEVTKEWNDEYLYDAAAHQPIKPEGGVLADNQYDRQDITFVLHGTINNGGTVVDLTPEDDTTTDLTITLSKDELNDRIKTAGGKTVYRDKTDSKEYTRTGEGTAASPYVYYEVTAVDDKNTSTTGSSSDTPAATQPKDENMEEALNSGGYKIDGSNYGVIFEGLQAYHDGQLIDYTVTEKMDKTDSFTVTGGTIEEVKESGNVIGFKMSDLDEVKENQDLLGYKANFTNTPIIDDKYNPLPIKIKKLDSYTGQPLANAEFTVYADPAIDLEPRTSTYKQIDGLTVWSKLEDETYTDGDSDYTVFEKEGKKYILKDSEYYEYDNGSVATSPADPQPTAPDVSRVATGEQYVKKADGKYYVVSGDTIGDKANPQPDASDLNKAKNTNYKKIYEGDTDRTGLEVWTDKKGHEYVLKNNEYYAVDPDGNIESRKANPQPTANTLSKIEIPGEVDEIVVVTDANGEAIVNINRSGIYTIEETKAPDGYTGDTKTYQFDASTELRKVEYMDPNENHSTHWWERLYELIFGPRTNTEKNWNQTDKKTGELTVKDDPLTAHVLVRKIWDDNNDQDGVRPKDSEPAKLPEMTLQYTIKDPAEATESDWKTAQVYDPERETEGQPDPGLVDVDTKKTSYAGGAIHKDNNNAYTWIDLPAYRDGKVVYYRIKETGTVLTDGTYRITKNETVATGDENFNLVDANKKSTNQIVEVANTHTPQILTIHATKRWLDNSNELHNRPGTLKITLYKEIDNQESTVHVLNLDGNADDPATGKAYEVASTEEGNTWNAIFKDLPAFENGAPIKYRLEETLSDDAQTWYVNSYYVTYTDTEDRSINDGLDFVVANDVKRTFVDEEETKKVGDTTYTVYKEGGNKYVRTGEGTDESPYTYYLIADDGTVNMNTPADPQPTSPVVSIVKKETTDATLKVENFSKNNFETYKYWIGGANANVRYQLYRSTNPDDMETKESTADPIKTGDQITVTAGTITGTFDVYNHANGKKYVDANTDPNVQTPEWHEIHGDGTTTPYNIDNDEATIEITTWTPYDLDAQGNPKYVNVNDPEDVKTKSEYDALPDDEKDLYEYKVKDNWEKVTDGPDRGEHLFVSSAFKTDMKLPGDDEKHIFENLPAVDSNSRPYTYRVFETTTAGSWTDARFEGHYTYDTATKKFTITNINKMVEEGSSGIDVLKDLSGREWDAKFNKTGKEADKDIFYFWIEPIKGVDPDTGEIIEFGDSAEDQAAKAKVPLPGDGNQYGRALSRNTAVGTTAREVSFSPILYGPTDIPEGQSSETFYYKVYESKDANGTIVTQKDDKGITYDGTTENNVWKPKTEVMKVVATADANNVVTASHSWEKVTKNSEAGTTTVDWTTETPVFKNSYSSAGEAKAWIEKNIQSREWVNYTNSTTGKQEGDAFQFTITSIAGANLNTEGATPDDSYVTMPLVTKDTHNNPQHDLQQLSNSMWAFGVNGNPYSGKLLGKNGEAYFIYEITENGAATSTNRDDLGASNYTVDGLTYDDSKIFAKVKVTDNWDGTLSFDVHYYSDASCKEGTEITQHKAWIVDKLLIESYVSKSDPTDTKTVEQYNALSEAEKAKYEAVYSYVNKSNPEDTKTSSEYAAMTADEKDDYTNNLKRLLSTTEAEIAKAMPLDQQKAAGYREVNIAHFDNRETVDIPVKKQWIDGPAVEDVTLHLERHLFPLTNEAILDGDGGVEFVKEKEKPSNWNPENYINKTKYADVISKEAYERLSDENKAKYEECGDFWQKLGYVHDVDRGDFLKQNGDPKYDLLPIGSKTSTKLIENEEGFNKDLPKYVVRYGVTYRAVYRLVEDDTSDAYTREYDPQYYINDSSLGTEGALVVKNTVVAQNTANIAAVKQFLGRKWLEADKFEFELLPYGVAVYNDKDEIIDIDSTDAGKAKVPMPATDSSRDSETITKGYINKADASDKKNETEYNNLPEKAKNNYAGPNADGKYVNKDDSDDIIDETAYNALGDGPSKQDYVAQQESTTSAVIGNTTVDPNGTLERLARFGAITYTTSDLEYDKTDRHMQGDFYYIMKEKLPEITTSNYPVECVIIKKTEGQSDETRTVEITDGKLPTLGTGERFKSVKFSNGITYDCDEHTVHVKVRENRTKDLQVQVAYDYTKRDDIASGTQFTPVVTNRYDAETNVTVPVNKYIMGRDWVAKDNFDFRMIPMAGAPFTDANPADFPEQNTYSHTERNSQLDAGNAVHNKEGEHVIRVTPDKGTTDDKTGTHEPVNFEFPAIKINISDLNKVITEENRTAPDPDKPDLRVYDRTGYNMPDGEEKEEHLLPLGTVYGQFMYAIEETEEFNDVNKNVVKDLEPDPDTEYARVTVYDIGDGVLRHYVEIFENRYATVPRYVPDPDTGEDSDVKATAVTFVNKLKRDLSVTKAWAGAATEDVTLKLQWHIDGSGWYDVDGTDWFPANIQGTKIIPRTASGKELTVTWKDLPAYADITGYSPSSGSSGADDLDLNDKWVYYQVVEVTPENAEVRYNEHPNVYEAGEKKDNSKYSTDPFHTGEEFKEGTTDEYLDPADRVKQLHVTNFPKDIKGTANVGVVKQYIGKNWDNETFDFVITPVKSKIGGDADYVDEGEDRTIVSYVHIGDGTEDNPATGEVIGPKTYAGLSNDKKSEYRKDETTVKNALPKYNGTNTNKATANTGTTKVSVNEHAANFDPLTILRSDLGLDLDTHKVTGEFIYKITEVVPSPSEKTDEVCQTDENNDPLHYYYVADDGKGNKIKYTTEEHLVKIVVSDDGGSNLNVTVSFDDRAAGEFVPVYTNYAQLPTPIEGSKTWIGDSADKHINGTVTIENNEITGATDDLELKLQRKSDKEGSSTETLITDDSGRELVIVWAQQVDTITKYKLKDEYEDDDTLESEYSVEAYEALDDDDLKAKYEPVTSKTWVKNETGDGVFTIKAKKVTGSGESATTTYVDPFLNVTDNDGYEYTYFIKESNVPNGYEDSYKDLNVTNSTIEDVTGTVQLKVDKVLTGRSFQRGDKYTYMVTGESKYKGVGVQVTRQNNVIDALKNGISNFVDKLFGSGEIEHDADDDIGNVPLPKDKTKEIAPSSGTKESVDFGTIKYTRGDLAKRAIKFVDATDAQKKSARYWTVKTTGEGEEAVTSSTTYDLTNGKDKAAWDALDDDVKKTATTTVYENVFTYKVMENPMDSAAGDTKPVENDTSIKTIVVYALLDQMNNKILVSSELFTETDDSVDPAVETNYFATGQDATSKTVALQPVTFVNVYTSAGEYDPSATKTLNGRPLERDQFDFKWERVAEEVPAGATEEWAIPEAPLATENPGNGLWDKKDDDKGQDVVKDANANPIGTDSLYGPIDFDSLKFTNENLKKKVKYTGTLTDETKNKVAAWEWKDGDNKEFVYGYIPDDAEAEVGAITVDGETNDEALKYKDATDAQRRAGKSDSLESVWKLDGKTYIAATTENSSILTDAVADDYDVVGYYYEDSRTYTYKLYEVIPAGAMSTATSGEFAGKTYGEAKATATASTATPAQRLAFESVEGWTLNGYTYDGVVRTVKVTIKDKGDSEDEDEDGPKDGNIVVTEIVIEKPAGTEEKKLTEKAKNITDPLTNFANTYEAEGLVELSIKKKLEGAESATTTPQKAEFTLAKVTSDAPMPDVTKKELVMDPSAANFKDGAWTVKFDDLEFTHEHFMEGSNYIATRVKGSDGKGYYERTFVYTVTETAMTEAGNNGVTSDANSKITVAVTVREDDKGNITVVAVNGLDSTAISQDDRVDFEVDRAKATTEGAAHSKVLAGTFTNKYQASGTATLKATKKLHGFDANGKAKELKAGQFEFVLKDNSIQTQGDNKVVHGVTNTVDTTDKTKGTVTFRTLTYNVEDLTQKSDPSSGDTNEYGVAKGKAFDIFTYTIKEVVPESDMIADGYIYGKSKVSDTAVTEKTVSVLVWDKGDGNLGVKYNKEGDTAPANFKESLADDAVTINNLYVGERTFVGTKIWVDGGQHHNNSDELAALLTLYKTTTKPENWTDETQFNAVQLSDYHIDWTKVTSADDTFTISGLPFDDGEGNRLYYKVVETAPQGYNANHSNKDAASSAPDDYTDGIASGGTITNVAKVGDVTISKKFVDKDGKVIPKKSLPAGFKIDVKYTTIVEEDGVKKSVNETASLTIGDDQPADDDGFYNWTVENVAYNTKVTAEELGYQKPTGYVYDSTTVDLKGSSYTSHTTDKPTYAEVVMPSGAATESQVTVDEASIAFTNVYVKETQDLWATKVWDDEDDADGIRPGDITLTLKAEDSEGEPIAVLPNETSDGDKVSERDFTFEDDTNSNAMVWVDRDTFKKLPIYDDKGGKIKYTLTEKKAKVPFGYTKGNDAQTVLDTDHVAEVGITNTHEPKQANVNLTKTWDDESNSAGLRQPTTAYLYRQVKNGNSYGEPTLVGEIKEGKITIADSDNVEVDWSNLPVIANGAPIRYSVKEASVKHYVTTVKYENDDPDVETGTVEDSYLELGYIDDEEEIEDPDNPGETIDNPNYGKVIKTDGTVNITNKYEPGVRDLEITKFWDDRDNVDGKRPETIKATIIAEFADGSAAKVFGSGLTKTNKKEVTLGIASSGVDKKFTKVDKNTWKWEYEPKKIKDPDNPGTMIDNPDYSGFELPEYVDDKLKATDRDPEGTNGREVFYYVDEETANVPTGYTKVVERTDYGTYKITNSYTPETVEAEITKVWDDDSNINKLRPETLTVELWRKYKDGSSDEGADNFEPVTRDIREKSIKTLISADDRSGDNNTWRYKVGDLPKNILVTVGTGENAKEVSRPITYFWREAVPANYQATASKNTSGKAAEAGYQLADNKATLTNSLDIDLVITKKWIDVPGNKVCPGTTAYLDSLKLFANSDSNDVTTTYSSDQYRSISDNGDGTYTITWTGLPRTVEGVKQVYYVTETKIDGYDDPAYSNKGNPDTSQASATDKAYNGGVITNKQLIKVDVVKKWNDNDNHDGQRPDMIKVTLYQNGVEYPNKIFGGDEKELKLADATTSSKSVDTLNENDTFVWENAWVDLPYADDNGTPYNYTATETNLDGSGLWGMLTNRKTIRQILLQEWKKVNNEEIKDTLIFRIDNDDTEDKVDFSVDKIWDDANDVDGLRLGDGVKPEKIYFRLYQTIDGQTTSVWMLPDGAKVKFRSNIDSTIEDVTSQYTEGYIAVEPKKDDKTQGTLNKVVFENLPKYARVNKGTAENPNWDSVEIEYSIKEDGDVEETDGNKTAHTPVIDDVKVWKSDKTKAITPYTTAYGGDYEKGITVTNKHEPVKDEKEPEAKKVITGRKFKSGDKFTFLIEPVGGAPRPARDYVTITPTVGQSEYTFKLPKFTFYGSDMKDKIENGDTKVFEYTVTELKGDLEDMTYDATSKTLKITVTRNEDGTIEIKDGGVVWGDGSADADTFTNVYSDTTKLVIRKIWSDDDADGTVLGSLPFDAVNELRPDKIDFTVTATVTTDEGVSDELVTEMTDAGFTQDRTDSKKFTQVITLKKSEDGTVFNRNVWQKTVDGLPKLDAAGEGITYRVDEKQLPNYEDPIVDPDGIDDGRWIITNVYKRASFTATKIWDDGNLKHDNAKELKNKLKLYRTTADDPTAQGTQWTEVDDKYHLHWNDDGATADNKYSQSFTITGLPEKDADGKQYTYRVVESSVDDKYTTTYENDDNTATSDYDESKVDEAVLDGGTITNSYQGKIIVKAQKVWEGDSEDKSKRSAVEFQLIRIRTEDNASRDVGDAESATKGKADGFEPIDGTNDDHYVVWSDLPTVVEGKAVSYDVKEVSVPDGYSSKTEYYNKTTDKWDKAIPDKDDWDVEKVGEEDVKVLKVRITNTLDVNETQVVVQKKWDDDDDQDRKRPKSVTVSITADDWDGKDIDGNKVDDITLNDDNNWKSVWNKLPKTNSENGKVFDYTVSEDAVDDYTTVVEYQSKGDKSWNVDKPEDWNNKVRVTNSYTPGKITVEVEKVWEGDDHLTDEERAELHSDVIVHLYGFKDEQVVYYAGSKKIEMDDQGDPVEPAMFANIPKRYFNDEDLDWKVVEDPVFGYTSTVSDVEPIDEGGKHYISTVTNTYAEPVTTVKVTKDWQDDENNDGKRPKNVYYQLWKKVGDKDKEKVGKPVKAVETPTPSAGTGETGQLDGWGYQWTKLPVTEEIETEETTTTSRIEYKHKHKTTGAYISDDEFEALPASGPGQDEYEKKWQKSDGTIITQDEYEEITDQTEKDDCSPVYVNKTDENDVIDETDWKALPVAGPYKSDYEYVPKEVTESGVKVKKEVPILYVVEEIYEKADWADLPDDDNLKDLGYEKPIVEASEPGEFNVINGRENETVDVKFTKMWNDHNDEDEIRPDHLTVVLKNDKDLPEKKVTITKGDDGWNGGYYTFAGLQKYVDGDAVDYSIVELDVDGTTEIEDGGTFDKGEYSVTILKENTAAGQPESWVITNTHQLGSTEDLVAIKEWEEYDGDKSKRTDVVFHLVRVYEDGARKIIDDEYPPITTATGTDHEEVLTATWTDLPTRIDKKPVAYTVEEETVDGYTTIVGDTVEKYEKVEAEGTEDPSALGWYEAEGEGYKPTEDTKVEDKDYFTRHHEVIVTNTKGVIPDRGDVIYVDPLGKAGGVGSKNMILKSTRYRTPEEAKEAMDKETNAPKVPSHPGKIFTGWAHNWDENDNFVLVATYADVADKPDPVVSYVDPQTGKIVTGVKGKVKKPADPKAKNMQFVKWVETTDAAGNTIYVAQYECDCSNGGGKSVDKSNVDTGDDAMLTVWMLLFVMAVSFMILTMMIRRRGINVVRDNYRPKH